MFVISRWDIKWSTWLSSGYSPGSEVLTTLNRLSVTRSWNFGSTWANGDFSRNVQHRRWFVILDLFLRTRTGKSSVNIEGDLSFLTYFSEPEPERVPCPTAVGGGGYVIQYGGRNWVYPPPPTAVGHGALYTLLGSRKIPQDFKC